MEVGGWQMPGGGRRSAVVRVAWGGVCPGGQGSTSGMHVMLAVSSSDKIFHVSPASEGRAALCDEQTKPTAARHPASAPSAALTSGLVNDASSSMCERCNIQIPEV